MLVGSRVGYLSTTSTQTTTTQTVQFLDTGIQLLFRPFISGDGSIRLELAPRVSVPSLRDVTDANGLLVTIPDEQTNELTTNVRVRDGQTLVLGGMFKEATSIDRRQVPLLGDIPILGLAFQGQEDTIERDEIMFLITPSIVKDEILWELGNEMLSYADSAMLGARKGLLPFGRTWVTANYNRDAIEAWRAGKMDLALHYVNASLRYNSNQSEIREMRREITGDRQRAYDASLIERAVRRALGPLPKEEVKLPREVVIGAHTGSGMDALQLDLDRQGPWDGGREIIEPDTTVSIEPVEPTDEPTVTPEPTMNIAPAAVNHPVTRSVPRMLSPQPFWRAGNPAGFDDPAFNDAAPFVTFDDMVGVADGGQ
ncbi:MAG: type II and III secretion system protein [Planctomycetota bacterium]